MQKLKTDIPRIVVAARDYLVLAVAGGVVEEAGTFSQVLRNFHTVWLKAKPSKHMERVRAQGDLRPMAGNPQAMEQLRKILVARESSYCQAEYHLDTSDKKIDISLIELCELIRSLGILLDSNTISK